MLNSSKVDTQQKCPDNVQFGHIKYEIDFSTFMLYILTGTKMTITLVSGKHFNITKKEDTHTYSLSITGGNGMLMYLFLACGVHVKGKGLIRKLKKVY